MNIDELRRKLHLTEVELANRNRAFETLKTSEVALRKKNEELRERMRKAGAFLTVTSSWETYDAPGACGFCGSLTCNQNCVK